MFICQFGMHNNVQGHRNANVCKQTHDASCKHAAWMQDMAWDCIGDASCKVAKVRKCSVLMYCSDQIPFSGSTCRGKRQHLQREAADARSKIRPDIIERK